MTIISAPLDRCRLPSSFWQALEQLGLQPLAVLQHAKLPASLQRDEKTIISTSQLFEIWNAIEALCDDPAFSIRMVRDTSTARHMLAFLVASYASDYRDALTRFIKFKRLCSPDRICLTERDGKVFVTSEWPAGTEPEPPLSVLASFALLLELGRRGTGEQISASAIELRRPDPHSSVHAAFFGCAVRFGATRDRMMLDAQSLALPFPGHNPELLQMLTPALAAAARDIEAQASIGERVKAVLKRHMASGRPVIASVARELGLSERTLQRQITAEGQTFRALLNMARQDLARQLLSDTSIELVEVAYLLGYQDTNSFYRAFRDWEDVSPGSWRRINAPRATSETPPAWH